MSLHMQPAWVRHVTLMSYDTSYWKKAHTEHKSQLHADTANQNRPTGLILQRLPQVICHHLIVQPSWCLYSTLFLTQQGRSSQSSSKLAAGFAIARSGFELFRYVMAITPWASDRVNLVNPNPPPTPRNSRRCDDGNLSRPKSLALETTTRFLYVGSPPQQVFTCEKTSCSYFRDANNS